MVDVISAFREQDTRDELGIGTIRDGFADILFPGTSTIQTRARYFLFVPWTHQALERKKVPSAQAAGWVRGREIGLIDALEKSGSKRGNIGREARAKLKRLPSNIYWQGLRAWDIRRFRGSQDQYYRSLDRYYITKGQMLRSDDDDLVSGFAEPNWHSTLPPQPKGFPREATFELRPEDSDYLRGRILASAGTSLLANLIRQPVPPADVEFVWESEGYGGFPSEIKKCVDHARCFSETMHGASLLYNLMLAELSERSESVDAYRGAIADWAGLVGSRMGVLTAWDHGDFWSTLDHAEARVPLLTRTFVMHWLRRLLEITDPRDICEDRELRDLVQNRERMLKRGQARLDNPRALELWSGAAGTGRLDYRWRVSRTILTDILEGFENA